MRNHIPELNFLLSKVEARYNRRLSTTTDFEALSVVIEHDCGEMISASTLKRLWGYVPSKSVPRASTLDVLCRFIGIRDFHSFCKGIIESNEFESAYVTSKHILCSKLIEGAQIRIGWNPNRIVTLRYLGGDLFTVENNRNSSLREGDIFTTSSFMLGYPLFIPVIKRDGENLPSYIAGSQNGLTILELL